MTHSELAPHRGEPSYVWRAGQERRLAMMAKWASLTDARVLVAGCGVGMYGGQIRARYTNRVQAFDIEASRVRVARRGIPGALVSAGEDIPFADSSFDVVLSHEVIEHVRDDRGSVEEMLRVTRRGGRVLLFCPNRWYPFETHGHYWRGKYRFGNSPLVNYLPKAWRDQLAPECARVLYRGVQLKRPARFDLPAIYPASLADLWRIRQHYRAIGFAGCALARPAASPGRQLAGYLGAISFCRPSKALANRSAGMAANGAAIGAGCCPACDTRLSRRFRRKPCSPPDPGWRRHNVPSYTDH